MIYTFAKDGQLKKVTKKILDEERESQLRKTKKINHKYEYCDIFAATIDEIFSYQDEIKNKLIKLKNAGHEVSIVVESNFAVRKVDTTGRIPYSFNREQLAKLVEFNDELKKLGMRNSIKFNEYFYTTRCFDLSSCWDLKDVIAANQEIEKVVERIKELNLSPYETMVYIHKYLQQNYSYCEKRYEGKNRRKREKENSIVGAVKYKQTVCVGFASLVKVIIDKLDNTELKCEYQPCMTWKRIPKDRLGDSKTDVRIYQDNDKLVGLSQSAGHALNLIYLNDQKYNIQGSYLNDETWNNNTATYAFFMYPVTDMARMREILSASTNASLCLVMFEDAPLSEKFVRMPMMGRDSAPIPYEVFEKAVENVYSLEKKFLEGMDLNMILKEELADTLIESWRRRTEKSIFPLRKQCERAYNMVFDCDDKNNIKYVSFYFKGQAKNSQIKDLPDCKDVPYLF